MRKQLSTLRILFALCSVVLPTSTVLGAPQFGDGVSVDSNVFFAGAGGVSGAPRSSEISRNAGSWFASAAATSGAGRIDTRTRAGRGAGSFGGYAQGRATPFLRLDELVVRKLPGFESLPNQVQVSLTLNVEFQRSGAGAAELFLRGGIQSSANSLGVFTTSTTTTVTTTRTLTVGVPFFVEIGVDVKSSLSGFDEGAEEAELRIAVDPDRVLEFALDGYTVDGATGFVEHNRIVHCANAPVGPGQTCAPVRVSVNDAGTAEGDSGDSNEALFTLALSEPSPVEVRVTATTVDDTARSDVDYLPVVETVAFAPGVVEQTLHVPVLGNDTPEPDRRFLLALSRPAFATLLDAEGIATILDDDETPPPPLPSLLVDDPVLVEGDEGTRSASFTLSLSAPSGSSVAVEVQTADGSAIADADYKPAGGVVTFPAGETLARCEVSVVSDRLSEADEDFRLLLLQASGAAIGDPFGLATIVDDDRPPQLRIRDARVVEGDTGSTIARFLLQLNRASGQTVRVAFGTESGSAEAGVDYVPASGSVEILPGELTAALDVAVLGDVVDERPESFFVVLKDPVGVAIARDRARGRIRDDDDRPSISIEDAPRISEGDGNSLVEAVFTVTLSHPSGRGVSVEFETRDSDAREGEDYSRIEGVLEFPENVTSRTVAVPVLGDAIRELDETFSVRLSRARFARIERNTGTAVVEDDDPVFSLFEPAAAGHAWANAHLLAYASLKVYEPEVESPFEDGFASLFTELGMNEDQFEFVDASSFFVDTQAAMMSNDDVLIIVFRGTEFGEPEVLVDLFTDAAALLVPAPELLFTRAHLGFTQALDVAYSPILTRALGARAQGKRVWVTGHSLGGALATLCALRLALDGVEVQGVYTYGSPRVGGPAFAALYTAQSGTRPLQRWVDDGDVVPLLPPPPVYQHVGQTNNVVWRGDRYRVRLDDSENLIPGLNGLSDHHPANYVERIRANVPASLRSLLPTVPLP